MYIKDIYKLKPQEMRTNKDVYYFFNYNRNHTQT
jgi:hypothetical protein